MKFGRDHSGIGAQEELETEMGDENEQNILGLVLRSTEKKMLQSTKIMILIMWSVKCTKVSSSKSLMDCHLRCNKILSFDDHWKNNFPS